MSVYFPPENDLIQTAEFGEMRRDVYERIMQERQKQPKQAPQIVDGSPAEPVRRCPLAQFAECKADRCAFYSAAQCRCYFQKIATEKPAEQETSGKRCPLAGGLQCNTQCVCYNDGCTIPKF